MTIWKTLTQENVITTVESTLNEPLTGLCIKRNSYINRVYELEKAEGRTRFIVKFYRPGRWTKDMILSEHCLLLKLYDAELPVIPPITLNGKTLFESEGFLFALYPKKGGRALDELDQEQWEQIGRLLGRSHAIAATVDISNRVIWRPGKVTKTQVDSILKSDYMTEDYKTSFKRVTDQLLQKTDQLFGKETLQPIHGDCHLGNLIVRPGEGIFLIDFDDIAIGPVVQDVWMLLPDLPSNCERELSWFRSGYTVFKDFPQNSLKLIPILRAMRIIHFAAWCGLQSKEPGFELNFPEWGSTKYWNETIRSLQSLLTENIQV